MAAKQRKRGTASASRAGRPGRAGAAPRAASGPAADPALRHSEELARQRLAEIEDLYRNAPVGLCVLDRDLRFVRINDRLAALNGIPAAEHLGKSVRELVPALAVRVEPGMRRVLETGQPRLNVEVMGETPAQPGVKRSFLEQWLPMRDADGRVTGLNIVVLETTERKAAEAAMRQLAQFPEQNPNPVLRVGADDRLLYANAPARAWLATLGWRADGPLPAALRDTVATARGSERAVEAEIPDPAGHTFWLAAIRPPGEDYVNLYGRDVTSRKQVEQALRQSREDLDRAQAVGQIGWWRMDTVRNVLTWSDENHRIFGIPPGTPLTYEAFLATVHPDDRAYVDAQWNAGLRGAPYDIEHRIVADGRVKWVREKAYLEFDPAGRLLGGFGISQDITARKQAEEALRESNAELRRFNDTMVGRELRMIELKKEINALCAAAGQPPRYDVEFADTTGSEGPLTIERDP